MTKIDLTKYGIVGTPEIVYNPSYEQLFEEETKPTLEGFEKTIDDSNRKGETIFTNYVQIENVLNVILDAREKDYGWKEIGKTLKDAKKSGMADAQIFESMDPLGNITLRIDDVSIALDSKKSIPDNAEVYYEKAKKAKRKIKGATIAIENTKKQLAEVESKKEKALENIMVPKKRVKKNLKWYEKLRWFLSSNGTLVVCGRDAGTNEMVVKKYLESNDIYMHADIHGAPSVVAKVQSDSLNDNLIKELGEFSASDIALHGGYSYLFNEKWSGGAMGKVLLTNYGVYSSLALAVDLGFSFYDEDNGVSIGFVAQNLGGQIDPLNEESEKLPFNLVMGFSKELNNAPIRLSFTLSDLTHWSEDYYYEVTGKKHNFSKRFFNHLSIGADVFPSSATWIAIGYNFRRANEMKFLDSSHWAGFSLGGGLAIKKFKIGLAYGKYHIGASSILVNATYNL